MLDLELKKIEKLGNSLDTLIHMNMSREDKIIADSIKEHLEEIYLNSKWYTCRYSAGAKIRVNPERLSENAEKWLETLEYRLAIGGIETKIDAIADIATLGKYFTHKKPGSILESVFMRDRNRIVRIEAGKHLGYSKGYIYYNELLHVIGILL